VKLCNNSDKCATFANATARIPEEEPEHESAVEVKLSPVNSIELDSPARNANEETSIKMNNSQQAKPSTHLDTRKKPNLTKLTSAPNASVSPSPTWTASLLSNNNYSYSTSLSSSASSVSLKKYAANRINIQNKRFDPKNAQKIVLEWCQYQTRNYKNVKISNFSSSWCDGLAFCALIHSFMPDAFDFDKLTAQNRRQNFELAFDTAYKANVIPLLEVNDMIKMGNRPDDRCVFTYVSTIYSRFQCRAKADKSLRNP